MIEATGKTPTRSLTAPLRGTQPLASAPEKSGRPTQAARRDALEGLSGTLALEAFAARQDARQIVKTAAYGLMNNRHLAADERKAIADLLDKMDQGQDLTQELADTLDYMRDKVSWRQSMESRRAMQKLKEERDIQAAADANWRLFYESLERYLKNLQAMAKVEASVSENKLNTSRSESKFAERLLTAAAAMLPEQTLTLLSAKLSMQKN